MTRPMRKLSNDMIHHMTISFASWRQPILTRQYKALASFPGFQTTKSLFYDHEFWYFAKFNLVLSTDLVQIVLGPLFGVHACFHLQMLHEYFMSSSGSDLVRESNCIWQHPTPWAKIKKVLSDRGADTAEKFDTAISKLKPMTPRRYTPNGRERHSGDVQTKSKINAYAGT
jgi:hypothetical protein